MPSKDDRSLIAELVKFLVFGQVVVVQAAVIG